jgi:glycosyltransferase involved in cell wall biosynthesis
MATARFWPELGGVETHCLEVGRRLVDAGHSVTVATTDRGRHLPARETIDGIVVRRFPAYPRAGDVYFSPGLARFIARSGADVVHCQGYHTAVAPLAMLAALAGGLPYVVTLHSGGHSSRLRTAIRPLQGLVLRPLLGRARAVIAVSRWEAQHFAPALGPASARLEVIPSGVGFPTRAPERDAPAAPGLIVSPGRLERYKGHDRVIGALPHVLARRPDARLRILGEGPEDAQLRRQAAALGLADRVEIGPAREPGQMARELGRAGVVVSLSEYESQGLAVTEALALGRPTVVAAATALGELVEAGLARGLAADASAQEIAAALVAALDGPAAPAARLPTWDEAAGQLARVYRRAAARPQRPGVRN